MRPTIGVRSYGRNAGIGPVLDAAGTCDSSHENPTDWILPAPANDAAQRYQEIFLPFQSLNQAYLRHLWLSQQTVDLGVITRRSEASSPRHSANSRVGPLFRSGPSASVELGAPVAGSIPSS
jgi:hypothetical protein